LTCAPARLLA